MAGQIDDVIDGIRIRTWSERQEKGWYLVVGFWWCEFPRGEAYEDDRIQVGPFDSQVLAHAELTGPFRKLIKANVKKFAEKRRGFTVDGKALDRLLRSGWPQS